MLFLAPGTYIRYADGFTYYRNRKFIITTRDAACSPSLLLSASVYLLIYLAPLIISLAVVSFDYETKRGPRRLLSRPFVCPLDPRCVVRHPAALLHPAAVGLRDTMVHYIMEYGRAIYRGAAVMLRSTRGSRRRSPLRLHTVSGLFGDCMGRGISHVTRFSCIKASVSSHRNHIELRY